MQSTLPGPISCSRMLHIRLLLYNTLDSKKILLLKMQKDFLLCALRSALAFKEVRITKGWDSMKNGVVEIQILCLEICKIGHHC